MWSSKYVDCEKSAKGSRAHLKQKESQLQPNEAAFSVVNFQGREQPPLQWTNAAFSVGCPTHEARRGCEQRETKAAKGSSAYMEQMSPKLQQKNASFSAGMKPQGQPKEAAISVGSNKEQKKGVSQLDKGTSSGFDEECKEFVRMFREKLQEFAMILSKKYHYNFPVEYFDDYHGSFNKEEFLEMEEPKEKSRLWKSDSLLTSNMEWKKGTSFSKTTKEECNISDEIGGEWHYSKGIYDEQIDKEVKAKGQSEIVERKVQIEGNCSQQKGKEVLDGDDFGILQQKQSNFKEEGEEEEEEEEEESEKKELEDDTQSIDSLSSTLTSAETLGQVSINEQSLAGSEVAASPNVNTLKQPWYEYSREEYKPPLLHFEAAVDISSAKHGCGLNGDIVTGTMAEDLPFLLLLDGYEVFPIEILGQFILGIDLESLRMKKKRPKSRKKERRIIRIEKVGVG